MKISALLNDTTEGPRPRRSSFHHSQGQVEMSSDEYRPEQVPHLSTPRKFMTRDAKDAPKFERGAVTGAINFPPFEVTTDDMRWRLSKLHVYPASAIAEFPRHIPYSSDKKGFQLQTGRDSFEVFQYTFRYNGGGKEWAVMWDYNIGLVRITPFFKALGFAKTIPAKAIAKNPGLKEMCHSITGGALAAQGYWMPYQAAKHLAATFCHPIRHALLPLFGPDFPSLCINPADPAFNRFTIDAAVVLACQHQVESWTASIGRHGKQMVLPSTPASSDEEEEEKLAQKRLRPRTARVYAFDTSDTDVEDMDETPRAGTRWTLANRPASPGPRVPPTRHSTAKRAWGNETENEDDMSSSTSVSVSASEVNIGGKRRKLGAFGTEEASAAYMLLQLSVSVC